MASCSRDCGTLDKAALLPAGSDERVLSVIVDLLIFSGLLPGIDNRRSSICGSVNLLSATFLLPDSVCKFSSISSVVFVSVDCFAVALGEGCSDASVFPFFAFTSSLDVPGACGDDCSVFCGDFPAPFFARLFGSYVVLGFGFTSSKQNAG